MSGSQNSDHASTTIVLVQRCEGGDDDSLDVLVRPFGASVSRTVRARRGVQLARREDVGDVAPRTWMTATASSPTRVGPSP